MRYYIANWKANKNIKEIFDWVNVFTDNYQVNKKAIVIICPPFPFLPSIHAAIKDLKNVYLGSQTLSSIEKGSYTGEVTAKSLEGLVDYAIIGHSERRQHFGETDIDLEKKVIQAINHKIEPIYCVRNKNDRIPDRVKFIAYEPVAAIGTGQNESLAKVLIMKKKLNLPKKHIFIYGGSVNDANVTEYTISAEIKGFLIGGASLDPLKFLSLINKTKN